MVPFASNCAVILMICLCLSSVSAFINRPINCPKELFDQNIVCNPGQALSSVTWDDKNPNCRFFQAMCRNATSSCIERCEWSAMCEMNERVSIEMEYVRGIHVKYQMMDEAQTVSFLCCHSEDLKTGILDCDGKSLTTVDGQSQPKLFSIMVQAMTVHYSGDLPIKATYCPVLNIPTCPPDKIQTNLEGGSFPVPGGTTGAGAGAGVYGLNLSGCYGPSGMLNGIQLGGYAIGQYNNNPSPTACLNKCKANPKCGMMTYDNGAKICFIYTPSDNMAGNPVFTSFFLCVTPAQYAKLQAIKRAGR